MALVAKLSLCCGDIANRGSAKAVARGDEDEERCNPAMRYMYRSQNKHPDRSGPCDIRRTRVKANNTGRLTNHGGRLRADDSRSVKKFERYRKGPASPEYIGAPCHGFDGRDREIRVGRHYYCLKVIQNS